MLSVAEQPKTCEAIITHWPQLYKTTGRLIAQPSWPAWFAILSSPSEWQGDAHPGWSAGSFCELAEFDSWARWWPEEHEIAEFAEAVADRTEDDALLEPIDRWLTGKHEVSMSDVLSWGLGLDHAQHTKTMQMRVGACMTLHGWSRVRVGQQKVRMWRREGT